MRIKTAAFLTVLLSGGLLPAAATADGGGASHPLGIGRADSWTDQFGETTYTIAAPDTVGIGDSVHVVLAARDPYYPNDMVAAPWSFLVDGVVEDNGFWVSLSDTTWESTYAFVYDAEDSHTFVFEAQDLGHGNGSHSYEWFEIDRTTTITGPTMSTSNPVGLESTVILLGSSPNPFKLATTIHYDLPAASRVSVQVHDLSGRMIRVLVDRVLQQAGHKSAVWDGRDDTGGSVGVGVYFYRLQSGSISETRSLVVLR